jgi:hypothetical protein
MTTAQEPIPFGEWTPDAASLTSPMTRALNVVPAPDGYFPMPLPVRIGPDSFPGDEAPNSCVAMVAPSGAAYTFVGTKSRLYRASRTGWYDVTRASGVYASAVPWSFVRWGNTVYANNGRDVMQKLGLDSDDIFFDVPGMPDWLGARYMAILKNQLVLFNIVQGQGNTLLPFRVWWSGVGRPETFATDGVTGAPVQSGFQDIAGMGEGTGIAGGEWATLVGTEGWRRLDPVGPPDQMSISHVEDENGCDTPGSLIRAGNRTLWYGPQGWRMSTGGTTGAVGAGRVDRWTAAEVGPNRDSVRSTVVLDQNAILWSFRGTNTVGTVNDRVLCYAYQVGDAGRWSEGGFRADVLGRAVQAALPLDDPSIRDIPVDDPRVANILVDDPSFRGGSPHPAAMVDGALCSLQVAPVSAIVETREESPGAPGKSMCLRLVPVIEGLAPALVAQVGVRDRIDQPVVWSRELRPERDGTVSADAAGVYLRHRLNVMGEVTRLLGVGAEYVSAGGRA